MVCRYSIHISYAGILKWLALFRKDVFQQQGACCVELYLLHSHCKCDYYINLSFWKLQFCKKILWGMPKLKYKYFDHIMWFDEFFWCPHKMFFSNFFFILKAPRGWFSCFQPFFNQIFFALFGRSQFSTPKCRRSSFYHLGGLEDHWSSYPKPLQLLL